jgi:hypothetical protein
MWRLWFFLDVTSQKTITVRNPGTYQLSYAYNWYQANWENSDSVKETKDLAQFNPLKTKRICFI